MSMFSVAPELKSMERSVSVLEGHTLTIPCEATGRPDPVIAWTAPRSKKFTDSSDLSPVKHISIAMCT